MKIIKELKAVLKIKCKVFGTLVEFSLHLLFQILLQRYNIQWFSGFSADSNTIRHQLKKEGFHSGWREIVRTMNTQKAVTTLAQNVQEEVILIRRCSEPNPQVRKIYDALKYKYAPFKKKKSVVHKSELDDCQFIEQQSFFSDLLQSGLNSLLNFLLVVVMLVNL